MKLYATHCNPSNVLEILSTYIVNGFKDISIPSDINYAVIVFTTTDKEVNISDSLFGLNESYTILSIENISKEINHEIN